ncbi:Calcium-binding EF hand protein-like [Rhynchospora pubera]|uniref:Calcium-binding EF hand protein-like n=1 Tax=Rhynchospora pubera TaxID=906938 RepID=A0AAV8EE46_9POAL|nr:Calcium-binding EF hand protein-like [Rhynchospora pubera]
MAAPSAEQFDAYFRAADLDQDGKITGVEAVSFFKGSNLPQQVLAQVWTYADQNRKGFLGRPEFYNALRLVTVAQTGRELTPELVKAALCGPAASQIPAPRINLSAAAPSLVTASTPVRPPVPASTPVRPPALVPTPAPQVAGGIPTQPNHAFRATTPQQQAGPRPMGPSPLGMSQRPPLGSQNHHVQTTPNLTTDWFSGNKNLPPTGGQPVPVQAQVQVPSSSQGTSQLMALSSATNNANSGLDFGVTAGGGAKDSKALVVSGNGFTSNSTSTSVSAAPADPFADFAPIPKPSTAPASGNQFLPKQQTGMIPSVSTAPSGPVVPNISSGPTVSGTGMVPAVAASNVGRSPTIISSVGASPVAQTPWPKIMQSDVQKYMTVFIKVDKDRDGKISGQEARNLFLSWKLPREVLKKVWDLSDQDKDGMLSFREFCTAVFLMERHREHRPLPDQLPSDIWSDGVSLPSTGQFSASHASPAPQQVQGFPPQGGVQVGSRSMMMPPGMVKPPPRGPPESDGTQPPAPPKSKVPVLEKNLVDQLSKEEQDSLSSKFQEASDAEKKVQELEKEIMESREKTEFYRTKMQELILYKSRCDNRLNEISERVSADKREVVSLSKKYEDKCKQLGDVASRLTLEEATFRDIQEKKMEIYNVILRLQKGDKGDDSLQERVNKIQSDLEEVMKTLNDKCKTYGLRTKPTTITELPFGWQPGILETADDWDDEWDKFEDGGFAIIKELTIEIEKSKKEMQPEKADKKEAATTKEASPDSSKEIKDENTEKLPVKDQAAEGDSVISTSGADDKKAQSPKSVPSSPAKKSTKKSNEGFEAKDKESGIFHDVSPRAGESISDRDGAESSISGDKYEHSWGPSFDHADDADSTWNFSDKDNESVNNDLFLDGTNLLPIKTGSSSNNIGFSHDSKPFFDSVPSTPMTAVYNEPSKPFFDSVPSTPMSLFGNNGPQRSFFDSSVPSTPMYNNSSFSPRYSEAGDDNSFDNFSNNFDTFGSSHDSFSNNTFSRYDSFRSTTDQGFGDSFGRFDTTNGTSDQFGSEKTFGRFDSMRSTTDPFDTSDTFGSSDPFGTSDSWGGEKFSRYDSMKSTADQTGSDRFARFDSMRSTTDRGYSFDDNDMFGSGPIKFSENNSPRHGTDNWSSF